VLESVTNHEQSAAKSSTVMTEAYLLPYIVAGGSRTLRERVDVLLHAVSSPSQVRGGSELQPRSCAAQKAGRIEVLSCSGRRLSEGQHAHLWHLCIKRYSHRRQRRRDCRGRRDPPIFDLQGSSCVDDPPIF